MLLPAGRLTLTHILKPTQPECFGDLCHLSTIKFFFCDGFHVQGGRDLANAMQHDFHHSRNLHVVLLTCRNEQHASLFAYPLPVLGRRSKGFEEPSSR